MRKNRILFLTLTLLVAISGMFLISSCSSSMTATDRQNARDLYNNWYNYENAVIKAAS